MRKAIVAATLTAMAAAGATALPANSATTSVSVRDNVFSPRSKTVARNTTVSFRWRGRNPHNVTITGPRSAKSRTITRGSFNFKATRKGTYRVVCTIHSGMTMTLKAPAEQAARALPGQSSGQRCTTVADPGARQSRRVR